MSFRIVNAEQLEWEEYDHFPGRFRAALTELADLRHTRANLIRHEPGAVGPRHAERVHSPHGLTARSGRPEVAASSPVVPGSQPSDEVEGKAAMRHCSHPAELVVSTVVA